MVYPRRGLTRTDSVAHSRTCGRASSNRKPPGSIDQDPYIGECLSKSRFFWLGEDCCRRGHWDSFPLTVCHWKHEALWNCWQWKSPIESLPLKSWNILKRLTVTWDNLQMLSHKYRVAFSHQIWAVWFPCEYRWGTVQDSICCSISMKISEGTTWTQKLLTIIILPWLVRCIHRANCSHTHVRTTGTQWQRWLRAVPRLWKSAREIWRLTRHVEKLEHRVAQGAADCGVR